MTQKDKELLLEDLCARLPYGIKVYYDNGQLTGNSVIEDLYRVTNKFRVEVAIIEDEYGLCGVSLNNVKPYLFPISSMTEEQKEEWRGIRWSKLPWDELNWLNKGHWDYRHLIEKGLALDATGLNIY